MTARRPSVSNHGEPDTARSTGTEGTAIAAIAAIGSQEAPTNSATSNAAVLAARPMQNPSPSPKNFFSDGRPIPPRAERIAAALQSIDWSRRDIVLWIPGTSEATVPAAFSQAVAGAFAGTKPVALQYLATWRFSESRPDGEAVLRAVLTAIEQRNRALPPGKRHRVYLLGQSQGAWIISDVLDEFGIGGLVKRAALFGHPAFAGSHYHDRHPRVLEINDPNDHVTIPTRAADDLVLEGVERLSALDPLGLALLARAVFQDPRYLWTTISAQLMKLRPGEAARDPHDYSGDARAGAIFLATGRRIGRAQFGNDANGSSRRS